MTNHLANNAASVLTSSISSAATTLVIALADASKFPTLIGVGDYFIAVLEDDTVNPPVLEIVKVTARTSNTLTVTRAQEGTAAAGFPVGATFSLRLTAGSISSLLTENPIVIPNNFITTGMLQDGAVASPKIYAPDIIAIVQGQTTWVTGTNIVSGVTLTGVPVMAGGLTVNAGTITATSAKLNAGDVSIAGTISLAAPLPVADGGTGATTFTSNGALIGNGTGAVTALAPGPVWDVIVSNGTNWVSQQSNTLQIASAQVTGALGYTPANINTVGNKGNVAAILGNFTLTSAHVGMLLTIDNVSVVVTLLSPGSVVVGGELEFVAKGAGGFVISLSGSIVSILNGTISSLNMSDTTAVFGSVAKLVNDGTHWRLTNYLVYPLAGGAPTPGPE
jgi:hypothetical protein